MVLLMGFQKFQMLCRVLADFLQGCGVVFFFGDQGRYMCDSGDVAVRWFMLVRGGVFFVG